MNLESITFVQYIGTHHPQTGDDMPYPHNLFAVPGGGVATRATLEAWAAGAGVKAVFL